MKKVFIILVFFLLSPFLWAGTGYTILETQTLPREFYVGDEVELRIKVLHEANTDLIVPSEFESLDWIIINDIRIQTSGDQSEIIIRFISFSPGTRRLPVLDLGDILLEDVKIYTNSILEDSSVSEVGDILPPVLIPSTRFLFLLTILLLILIPLLTFFCFRWFRKRIRTAAEIYRKNRPYKRIMKVLRSLEQKQYVLTPQDFYSILTDEFKNYLSFKLKQDCKSFTTKELNSLIRNSLASNVSGPLSKFFHTADMVKFAAQSAAVEGMEKDLEAAISFIDMIEQGKGDNADVSNS